MPVPRPLWDRIWEKVEFTDGCWIWKGAKSTKRNGDLRPIIKMGKPYPRHKVAIVARLVCERYHGAPPTPEHEAGHTCPGGERNDCVNPAHLEWQTRGENERFKQSRRRHHATEKTETRTPDPACETPAEDQVEARD